MNQHIDEKTKQMLNDLAALYQNYQDLLYEVFTSNKNVSYEINETKKHVFEKYFMKYYNEIMENIMYVIDAVQKNYEPKYLLSLVDFIDLIYQNSFYDIFAKKMQELENKNPEYITKDHLKIFHLIIFVEHIKYKLYEFYETKVPNTNDNIKNTLLKRKNNAILKMNVCMNILQDYMFDKNNNYISTYENDEDYEYDCKKIITKYKIFNRNLEYTKKFFTDIN